MLREVSSWHQLCINIALNVTCCKLSSQGPLFARSVIRVYIKLGTALLICPFDILFIALTFYLLWSTAKCVLTVAT